MGLNTEKTVSEAIQYRRSVRVFKNKIIEDHKVKECIRLASLAPTSSNMQLWEFYHITSPKILEQLTEACLGQNAAKTAQQMVVVVNLSLSKVTIRRETRIAIHKKRTICF